MLDIIGHIVFGFFKYGAIIFFSFFGIFCVNQLILDKLKLKVKIIDDIMFWLTENFVLAIFHSFGSVLRGLIQLLKVM